MPSMHRLMLPIAQYQHPYLDLGVNINSLLNDDFEIKEIKEIKMVM